MDKDLHLSNRTPACAKRVRPPSCSTAEAVWHNSWPMVEPSMAWRGTALETPLPYMVVLRGRSVEVRLRAGALSRHFAYNHGRRGKCPPRNRRRVHRRPPSWS